MSEKLEPIVYDKSSWGPGPWQTEPDRVEFEAEGYPCLITRHQTLGTLCGYVAVPPGHPLHGKDPFDDRLSLNAHGGVNYGSLCSGHICHVPKPGEPDDVWWFGFDCGHAGDLSPGTQITSFFPLNDQVYRDIAYVRGQCEWLAHQLKELEEVV